MPKFGDRVKETTDTTGTGTVDLSGAPTGFRSFSDEFTSGDNDISYLIVDDPENPSEYEYGKGTYTAGTPDTFARDTVEGSSNSGNKVSFAAGTKTIIATPTSADFNVFGGDGPWASKSALTKAITGNTTQIATDDGKLILADGSGNSPVGLTYTLLAAATAGDGFVVKVVNTGASGTITIDGSGSETINGATTATLSQQYESITLRCDGTEWFIDGMSQRRVSSDYADANGTVGQVFGVSSAGKLDLFHQGLELVELADLTNGGANDLAEVDFAPLVAGYTYLLDVRHVSSTDESWTSSLRFRTAGGSVRVASGDYYSSEGVVIGTGAVNTARSTILMHHSSSPAANVMNIRAWILGARDTTVRTGVIWDGDIIASTVAARSFGSGNVQVAEDNDLIRYRINAGTFDSGTAFLYRLREPV